MAGASQRPARKRKIDFFYMHTLTSSIFFSVLIKQDWICRATFQVLGFDNELRGNICHFKICAADNAVAHLVPKILPALKPLRKLLPTTTATSAHFSKHVKHRQALPTHLRYAISKFARPTTPSRILFPKSSQRGAVRIVSLARISTLFEACEAQAGIAYPPANPKSLIQLLNETRANSLVGACLIE
jgi:hypothetical protein